MNKKWISTSIIALTSVLAVVCIILESYDWAIFSMTIMFTLTNTFRAKSFKEQGYVREAKWMQITGIFFALAAIAVLYIIISG